MFMKNRFLKSALALSAVLAFVNCSEEATDAINNNLNADNGTEQVQPNDVAWLLDIGQDLLIYPAGIVTDANGSVVGTITFNEDGHTGSITAPDGTPIVDNIDVSLLEITTLEQVKASNTSIPASSATTNTLTSSANATTTPDPLSSASVLPGLSSATDLPGTSSANVQPTSSADVQQGISSSVNNSANSSSSQKQSQSSNSNTQQTVGNITVTGNLTQTVAKGGSISKVTFSGVESEPQRSWTLHFLQANYDKNAKTYTLEGSVPDYWDQAKATEEITIGGQKFSFVLTVDGAATAKSSSSTAKSSNSVQSSSSQQQPKSSSSVVKSSSSVTPSSSSVKSSSSQNTNTNASAEEAKYLNAGVGGQPGWATRYWDCCMPHCAQPAHGGTARTCSANGGKTVIDNNSTKNICQEGGQGATCTSQIPIIVSEKLAYAFAATPGNDNTCGKCFALTFTGEGKYETKENHKKLKGKTLVVMASNIGYDVAGGQFDVMIPGGGFGAFNGCAQMGWNIPSNTTTYGGFLSDCENESGYDGDVYSKRKECLTKKCNSAFANDTEAKEGCLFLATWMEAAGNPNHTYKEVECPQALKAKY